jgi:hypothetical protein
LDLNRDINTRLHRFNRRRKQRSDDSKEKHDAYHLDVAPDDLELGYPRQARCHCDHCLCLRGDNDVLSIRSQARAAHRQSNIAETAAKAAEKAAIAATRSAEAADKALRIAEKAALTVLFQRNDFTLTSVPLAPFRVLNTGHTRAFVKEYFAGIYISKKLPPIPLQFPAGTPTSDDISPTDARKLTAELVGATAISPTEMEQIVKGETVLYIAGKVSYYDEFGKSHFTVFTRKYDPTGDALVRPMEPGYNYSDQA